MNCDPNIDPFVYFNVNKCMGKNNDMLDIIILEEKNMTFINTWPLIFRYLSGNHKACCFNGSIKSFPNETQH